MENTSKVPKIVNTNLLKTNVWGILSKTLPTYVKAILPDHTMSI